MSDETTAGENWQLRAEAAEAALERAQAEAQARIIRAELKAEAVKAGMVDLDGLKLIDAEALRVNEQGEVEDAPAVLTKLKRTKPWLFGGGRSSSAAASAPRPEPPRQRMATEMSRDEWLQARAALLKRR
ncbi:MAG: hypothetical protein KGQ79_05045 [Proteobacteria bacterium]|nr:hypothetical protein [Pseudomonadota bacterium]MBU6425867.1 hypothetical protein [Rhodospirillales bacterium]